MSIEIEDQYRIVAGSRDIQRQLLDKLEKDARNCICNAVDIHQVYLTDEGDFETRMRAKTTLSGRSYSLTTKVKALNEGRYEYCTKIDGGAFTSFLAHAKNKTGLRKTRYTYRAQLWGETRFERLIRRIRGRELFWEIDVIYDNSPNRNPIMIRAEIEMHPDEGPAAYKFPEDLFSGCTIMCLESDDPKAHEYSNRSLSKRHDINTMLESK